MRVLFVTWNSTVHLAAMTPLNWAFVAAGHEVVLAAPPAEAVRARRRGLTAVAVGTGPPAAGPPTGVPPAAWPPGWQRNPELLDDNGRAFLTGLARKQRALAELMLPGLVELAADLAPDLVVYDAATLAGEVVAAREGVPALAHSWGRVAPVRLHHDAGGARLPEYAELFTRFGAPVPDDAPIELDPCPAALRAPGDPTTGRRPIRAVSRMAPAPGGDTPRLVVLPDGPPDRDPLGALPRSLADLGAEITLAAADDAALPACDVLVHRGSGPALLAAAASGVPQLVVSARPEQHTAGERVAAAKAGVHRTTIPDATVLGEDLRSLVRDPAYREGAAAVAASARTAPTPAEVVARVERDSSDVRHRMPSFPV